MLYRLLRFLARAAVGVFHRRVWVEHVARVPLTGPVVFAANHPNMMLDVLLVGTTQPRKLHFLAKSTLFEHPVLRYVLRTAGTLPVYRRDDAPDPRRKNLSTFAACHQLLSSGGALAIFPEGVSHAEERVLPLKTGCARIVLEAEALNGFALGVRVIPVGIAFANRERFRADAHVVFGEPLDPTPYLPAYREGRQAESVRELTAALGEGLERVAVHVPLEEDRPLVTVLRHFYAAEERGLSAKLAVDRQLIRACQFFREREPIDYARLRRRLLAYGRVLSLVGLDDDDVDRSYHFLPAVRYLIPRLALAVLGLVPFLAGLATHYLPYKVPGWVADRPGNHPVIRATLKLSIGVLTFPLAYALETIGIAQLIGVRGALVALLLLPPLGLFSLVYAETLEGLIREIRIFLQRRRREQLASWRRELAEQLELRRGEYEKELAMGS